jgi:hypothetical protein
MSKKRFTWKVWLRFNFLTKKVDNDYVAEVSTVGNTLRNEDIARLIVEGRSEYRYETILSILNERDTVVRDTVLGGSSVQDSNIHLAPLVTGAWIGSDPVYNPKEHKNTVSATLTNDMRAALENVNVEVLGKKTDGGAIIGLVTDVLTGKTDGTISTGGDIFIRGEKIKIAPDNVAALGVFFVDAAGTEIPLDHPITENGPKKIVCRVPLAVTAGEYTLKIVTQFANGTTCLKEPRTIIYDLPLKVDTEHA